MPYQITRYQYLVEAVRNHGESNACLLWPFALDDKGYARIIFEGRPKLVHRIAYLLKYGVFPVPCGLHACDTPRCFNPKHIYPGTFIENNKDRHDKGRDWKPKGEINAFSKLTDEAVAQIRTLYAGGTYSLRRLAARFSVTKSCVQRVVKCEGWGHVPNPHGTIKPFEKPHERYEWLREAVANCDERCLIWPFKTMVGGYGRIKLSGYGYPLASELAHLLKYGSRPSVRGVHKCPSKACINPDHVYPQIGSRRGPAAPPS